MHITDIRAYTYKKKTGDFDGFVKLHVYCMYLYVCVRMLSTILCSILSVYGLYVHILQYKYVSMQLTAFCTENTCKYVHTCVYYTIYVHIRTKYDTIYVHIHTKYINWYVQVYAVYACICKYMPVYASIFLQVSI